MEDEPTEAEHQESEADECVPVRDEGHRVLITEDAEHELGEMIGRQSGREDLQPMRHESERHPQTAEERHWQIDEIDDGWCGVCWDKLCEQEAHAGEAYGADDGH